MPEEVLIPKLIRTYEKIASSDVETWLKVKEMETKKKKQKKKKDDPRTIAFNAKLNLDDVLDIPDYLRKY